MTLAYDRAVQWLVTHEYVLAAERDAVTRLKHAGDLAFVAARMVRSQRDVELWSGLAARAWARLDHGDQLRALSAWPVPAMLEPFVSLGLARGDLPRVDPAPNAAGAIIVAAARLAIAGGDPGELAGPAIAQLREPAARRSAQACFLALHVVFAVWPHGVPPPYRAAVEAYLADVVAPVLATGHVDLAAEVLLAYEAIDADAPALRELVAAAQCVDGMLPAYRPPIRPAVGDFEWGYHATLAGLLVI